MFSEIIELSFDKIMQTRMYTVVVMNARGKKFAIYTEPTIGKILQSHLTGIEQPRPLTHDLITSIFMGLDVRIRQVVINDVEETIYYARLFLEQEVDGIHYIIELDARPSDCIALALINNAPVYCTHDVLEKTVAFHD